MTLHTTAMHLLKEIYDSPQGIYQISHDDFSKLPSPLHLQQLITYLKESQYVTNYMPSIGYPISVRITADGIRSVEHIQKSPSAVSINFSGTNNGIIGTAVTGNTVTITSTFEQFEKLANEETMTHADREAVLQAVKEFYNSMNENQPISKGILSKVAHILSSHQALIAPIETAFMTYLLYK